MIKPNARSLMEFLLRFVKRKTLCNYLCSSTSSRFSASRVGDFVVFPRYPSTNWDKSWYFHFYMTYDHQTWQDGNLPWWAPAYKHTWTLIMWSCKITWQTKIIISSLPQCLWPPNLASWWLAMRGFYYHPLVTWSCKVMGQT